MPAEIEGIDGRVRSVLLGKEIASGLPGFIPVFSKDVQ